MFLCFQGAGAIGSVFLLVGCRNYTVSVSACRVQELSGQFDLVVKEKKTATAELQAGVEQFRSRANRTLTALLGKIPTSCNSEARSTRALTSVEAA